MRVCRGQLGVAVSSPPPQRVTQCLCTVLLCSRRALLLALQLFREPCTPDTGRGLLERGLGVRARPAPSCLGSTALEGRGKVAGHRRGTITSPNCCLHRAVLLCPHGLCPVPQGLRPPARKAGSRPPQRSGSRPRLWPPDRPFRASRGLWASTSGVGLCGPDWGRLKSDPHGRPTSHTPWLVPSLEQAPKDGALTPCTQPWPGHPSQESGLPASTFGQCPPFQGTEKCSGGTDNTAPPGTQDRSQKLCKRGESPSGYLGASGDACCPATPNAPVPKHHHGPSTWGRCHPQLWGWWADPGPAPPCTLIGRFPLTFLFSLLCIRHKI